MSEKQKTRRERSIDWQNRYINPILLPIVLIAVAASWAVGRLEGWIAIVILAFGVWQLVALIRKNKKNH